jgi:hypothetical protein
LTDVERKQNRGVFWLDSSHSDVTDLIATVPASKAQLDAIILIAARAGITWAGGHIDA